MQNYHQSVLFAFIAVLVLSLVSGPLVIPALKKLNFGQTVRDDGPATHLKKNGIPTIGGIIFLVPIILVSMYFATIAPYVGAMLLVACGCAAVGFADDYIKVVKKSKDGLNPKQKSAGVILISLAFSLYVALMPGLGTYIRIPFLGPEFVIKPMVWLYVPFITLVMYLIINSVNMTDGVDGLAASVTAIVGLFFAVVALFLPKWAGVGIFSAMLVGGCIGFLAFNRHPAKVFMGDTGSLALGGIVGAAAVIMQIPWILLIAGGVYAAESLSVFIQVASYKSRGKRVFKMAPIHHHFELGGWKETKVVAIFSLVTLGLCLLSLLILRVKIF